MNLFIKAFENYGYGSHHINDKEQRKNIFAEINALPLSDHIIGLSENQRYIFPLQNNGFSASEAKSIKIGTNSKEMSVTFGNESSVWDGTGEIPTSIIITTKKCERFAYVSFEFDCGGNTVVEVYYFMVCVPEENAKIFAKLPVSEFRKQSLILSIKEDKGKYPVSGRTFTNINIQQLDQQQIEQLKQRTGWTEEYIKNFSAEQQQHYYTQYIRGHQQLTADKAIIKIVPSKESAGFAFYISDDDANYIVMQTNYQLIVQYFDTTQKPELFGNETHERNGTIQFYLKNCTDLDVFDFTKKNQSDLLNVVAEDFPNGLNVFWSGIFEAARYTIEIFRSWDSYQYQPYVQQTRRGQQVREDGGHEAIFFDNNQKKVVYLASDGKAHNIEKMRFILKEQIDRDRCLYVLPDIVQGDYLVRIFAENRQGEVIAKSAVKAVFVRRGQ